MNRGAVKTALQALGYATDTDTQQNEAIMSAVRRVAGMHRWPWQETAVSSVATTLVVAQTALVLGTIAPTWAHIDAVRAAYGTTYLELDYAEPQWLQEQLNLDHDNGPLTHWTKYAGFLLLYPRADAPYELTIEYIATPTTLTGDSDELPLPDEYDDIIKWGAVAQLAFRERDWNAYNAANTEFLQRVHEAWAETNMRQRQSSSHVARSGVWDRASYLGPGSA